MLGTLKKCTARSILKVDNSLPKCYNYSINSKESDVKITVKIPKQVRAHIVLFCKDTPFKQKRVESKVKFKRNPKHKGREL